MKPETSKNAPAEEPMDFFRNLWEGFLAQPVVKAPVEFVGMVAEDLNERKDYTLKQIQTWMDATKEVMDRASDIKKSIDENTQKALNNRIISSVIGNPFGNFQLSGINTAFRENGRDISVDKLVRHYIKVIHGNNPEAGFIIYVHGLFNDENLWIKKRPDNFLMAESLKDDCLYPLYVRYHPGLHISENGKKLSHLLRDLFQELRNHNLIIKIDVVTYSMGGLIFRSALYTAMTEHLSWREEINKVVFVSSPDGGSYLEKIGFWLALGLSFSRRKLIQRIAIAANIRAESMKDLSHGIIREEDWKNPNYFQRFFKPVSYGELEGVDAYQIFSLLTAKDSRWQNWMGDGIVEFHSLAALKNELLKKNKPESRSFILYGKNHFNIVDSYETYQKVREILFGN
jgi:pimeloyl-ACP methyl ester carboxylesterase